MVTIIKRNATMSDLAALFIFLTGCNNSLMSFLRHRKKGAKSQNNYGVNVTIKKQKTV
jgi:hypothetical protein